MFKLLSISCETFTYPPHHTQASLASAGPCIGMHACNRVYVYLLPFSNTFLGEYDLKYKLLAWHSRLATTLPDSSLYVNLAELTYWTASHFKNLQEGSLSWFPCLILSNHNALFLPPQSHYTLHCIFIHLFGPFSLAGESLSLQMRWTAPCICEKWKHSIWDVFCEQESSLLLP